MADTIEAVYVTQEWQDVATLTESAFTDGEGCIIQNQSGAGHPVIVALSPTEPTAEFKGWLIPAVLEYPLEVPTPEAGSKVWVKSSLSSETTLVSIQKL